jgi:beta-lactamase regulating signal transducer with metallopeptidase domain
MLWSWLAVWVLDLFTSLFNQLPSDVNNVPQWLTDPGSAVDLAVSKLAPLGSILPVGLMVTLLWVGVCVILPVVVGIMVVQFLWDHMPSIAGFGT